MENDRLDNDREVGIALLDESDMGEGEDQPPAKTSDNEGDRVA